jgi:hypothetical protein
LTDSLAGPPGPRSRPAPDSDYLLLHVGPLIDEMQLTRNEAELAYAFMLGESLSHRENELRELLAAQWHEIVIDTAAHVASVRQQKPGSRSTVTPASRPPPKTKPDRCAN